MASVAGGIAVALFLVAGIEAHADVLDRIRETGTVWLAHRTDAAPFSSLDSGGQPLGYLVEPCRRVVERSAQHCRHPHGPCASSSSRSRRWTGSRR